jgi:hypothetical protein
MSEEYELFLGEGRELARKMAAILWGKTLGHCCCAISFLMAKISEEVPAQSAEEFLTDLYDTLEALRKGLRKNDEQNKDLH